MASSTAVTSVLAALKAHAVAVAVAGTVLVGGGAAAAAVTTGAVHLPGQASSAQSGHTPGAQATNGAAARQAACAQHNGDAQRLASTYAPMFGNSATDAQTEICTLFVGSDGHAVGYGEAQQMLDIAAAIEANNSNSACLTTPLSSSASGKPSGAGKPTAATVPTATAAATNTLLGTIQADAKGSSLAHLAANCGATVRPDGAGTSSGSGDQGEATPSAKPTDVPGGKPTGTPGNGSGHP
jgi:hypothetical protein